MTLVVNMNCIISDNKTQYRTDFFTEAIKNIIIIKNHFVTFEKIIWKNN